ncbi:DUF4007 family protein [Robiginitalea sp. M366]|uniref:DUF4007 family protein n=1 Tax=Robiginitalea aestuariiviva TaxID=3036903 RepID=UPI00240D2D6B|nr:DUF4007 family protein [Robiginitalea aestuariiviva]MDG1571396.1 DUF4007 family protein [Robiginitalea aestuariiviva]
MKMYKMTYSGHETFHCRLFWLKKGYDYLTVNDNFSEESGVDLGVGKNMINSIRYWMKAFGALDEDNNLSALFQQLLNDEGWDPYLEHQGTNWLLHYMICKTNNASIYREIFSELRKLKPEFSKEHFVSFAKGNNSRLRDNILGKDFSVFIRTYMDKGSDGDGFTSGLLADLNLVHELGKNYSGEIVYRIENRFPDDLPNKILLFSILDNPEYSNSIDFNSLYSSVNGPGNIFALNERDLESKLEELADNYPSIVYKNEAGVKELQFKQPIDKWEILDEFYAE